MQSKTIEVPEYDGSECTSNCRREGCDHGDAFDEAHGIFRSKQDFDVKHDKGTREFVAHVESMTHGIVYQEKIADQEQKWGEERISTNE